MRLHAICCLLLLVSTAGCNTLVWDSGNDAGTETITEQPPASQTVLADGTSGPSISPDVDTERVLPYANSLDRPFSLETESEYTAEDHPVTLSRDFIEYNITNYHSRTFLRDRENETTPSYLLTAVTIHETGSAASTYAESQVTGNGTTEQTTVGSNQRIQVQVYEQSNDQTVVRTTGTVGPIAAKVTGVGSATVDRNFVIDILAKLLFRVQSQVS
ncbi:hypothetical protein EGH21_23650 [Halomicroarcula sp. F13]|uniref:Uncharacterized protein n=1 Tax=Haloarcula rubra TaxID=2487747 RepID=A0AAW4PXY1_9EURY|nr:hypothetical protein [Halomicroarcula rubra]MBX0326012.1 hypothetical protein [Halomicroarcula rubra]